MKVSRVSVVKDDGTKLEYNMPDWLSGHEPPGAVGSREEKLFSVVLPGALLPWMFQIPRGMMPPGMEPMPAPPLAECYRLSMDSYRLEHETILPDGRSTPARLVSWLDQARSLRPHERPAPPSMPDFWQKVHERTRSPWTIGGMA